MRWAFTIGAVLMLAAACGSDSSIEGRGATTTTISLVDDDLERAQRVCESYVASVAPAGAALLLVIPQSVQEVRMVSPAAWPDKSDVDRVMTCSYSLSAPTTTTVCPDGSIVGGVSIGDIVNVSLDLQGNVDSQVKLPTTDFCEPSDTLG